MADDPIQQDISQASFAAGPAMPAANEDQQTPTALPIDRTGSGIGVHDSSGTSFGAPSTQDATAGSPQSNLPSSVTQAPKTAQPDYKESWSHKALGALAGGTHNATYHVDPDTGKIGVELKPKTGREEIMGAVANILSGLAAGAGQKNFYKGFSAGAQQVSQQLQQQRGQQRQESIDDYNQQQQAKVQKAQAMHTNLQMLALAQDIGRKDKEDHDAMVAAHADNYEDLKEQNVPGADKIVGEEDLKSISGSDMIPIPVGTVPRIDPNTHQQSKNELGIPQWNNTYVVVPKNATVSLTDEEGKPKNWVTQAQSWGVMPDKKVSPQTLPYRVAAGIDHTVAALNSFNTELKNFATKINVPPVDLKAALKADPTLKSALQKFQKTVGMSTQPDIQVDALRQKDSDAAAKIANLFGPDNLEKYKNQRIDEAAAGKTAVEEKARLDAKANDPLEQQRLSNAKLEGQKTALDIKKLNQDIAQGDPIAEAAKNIVAGDVASMKDISSYKTQERTRLYNAIATEARAQGKDPNDFSPAKLNAKGKVIEDFADGKAADQLVAFNTFLGHANDAAASNESWRRSNSPLINKPLNWLAENATNDPNFQNFQAALIPVRKEFMSFLNANRAEHEADIKEMDNVLSDTKTPAQVEVSLKKLAQSSDIRLAQLGRKYSNTIGSPYPNLISPEGQQALQRLGVTNQKTLPAAPAGATHTAPGSDNQLHYTDAQGHDLGVVPK